MSFLTNLSRKHLAWGCLVMAALILLSVNILSETALRRSTFDLTDERLYTLTDGTREVLKNIDEPIKVRLYFSSALGERAPTFKRYFERVRTILEQYADISGGMVQLDVFDPEPFSDAEDRAVAAGLQGVPLGNDGVNVYFGIYATNSTDNETLVPFVALERERFLEYDLTKMIYSLAHPEKNVVGLMSALPIAGGQTQQGQQLPEWQVLTQIKEVFEVQPLVPNVEEIPENVNLLMIVQPVGLTDKALYAIDQFVMKGGKALVFVDPQSDAAARRLPGIKGGKQDTGIERLLTSWGVELAENRVLGDIDHARKVQFGSSAQPVVVDYVAWLALGEDSLDADDVVSGGIEKMHIASGGILDPIEGAETAFTPLLVSGERAMRIDTTKFTGIPNPNKLLEDYKPGGEKLTLAARVTGKASTAYPDGPPKEKKPEAEAKPDAKPEEGGEEQPAEAKADDAKTDEPAKQELPASHTASGAINIIVIADSDLLHDNFWVRTQDFLGQQIIIPEANNADFVLNSLDNLTGGEALIGLRGRGVESRPFHLVDQIRRDAEQQYRQREQALNAKLEDLQKQLKNIERKSDGKVILTAEEKKAIENFRQEMVVVRQELRSVKRALRRDIDRLDTELKLANIAAVPILIGLGGIGVAAYRRRRRKA